MAAISPRKPSVRLKSTVAVAAIAAAGLALATTGRRIATTSAGSVLIAATPDALPAPPTPLQTGLWRDVTEAGVNIAQNARRIVPDRYRTVALDAAVLRDVLSRAPLEFTPAAAGTTTFLELPWPDGSARTFRIEESPIMAPGLAAQYPALRTYSGQGVDDPTASLRFDWTPQGFHAMVLSADGTVYVDPYSPGNITNYISYYKRDYRRPAGQTFTCGVTDTALGVADRQYPGPYQPSHGTTLRTYRLALAATGEYTAFFGGTVNGAMNGIVTSMNRVNGLYERDLAVRMMLVTNESSIIYTDANTDPYTNNNGGTMLGQNQSNLDAVIGTANYDIGHVFSTGGGGVATLNGPCSASSKARGVTGSPSPSGDGFDVDYVAHEMGHQFGANHTFNGTTSSCGGGNRSATHAYEPGSGTTIMAYAGICGAEDLQPHSDDDFHADSQTAIIAFITGSGNTCAVSAATGNTPPVPDAGADYTIPQSTPFTLTGSATDANGDSLTYDWEQFDLGTASPPNTDDGTRPIFRSFVSSTSSSRTFPKMSDIVNNTSTIGESLPTTNRTMHFRLTVRDNRVGGGGTASDDMSLTVNNAAGPFVLTQPNSAVNWPATSVQTVTWNVANTSSAPVSVANVKISLSTDGGFTYPALILASTANDGSQSIIVPNMVTTTARIKVEAVGNVFFDISNTNFTISAAPPHQLSITSGPSGVPNPVASAGGVGVAVTASDTLGHALSYGWSASCPGLPNNGSFTNAALASTTWTAPVNAGANQACTISVLVSDGFGLTQNPLYSQVVTGPPGGGRKPGDFDGDGKSDRTIFRPGTGTWYEARSGGSVVAFNFGLATDVDVPADYDGDGKTDEAMFRPNTGVWFLLMSTAGPTIVTFGMNGDVPLAGDVDGDGKADLIIWRPSTGVWYAALSGGGTKILAWGGGAFGDIPLVGDYDGDGKADFAVWRPSSGTFYVARASGGIPIIMNWGGGAFGDQPIAGDWDGDGKTDFAVWRASTGFWYIAYAAGGFGIVNFGSSAFGDIPLSGDWDGDGKTDIAVWRPTDGVWYVSLSGGGFSFVAFGTNGDRPILRRQ